MHSLAISIGSILSTFYVWMIVTISTNMHVFRIYTRETFSLLLNSIIGICGLTLNILNVLLVGFPIKSIDEIVGDTVCCDDKKIAKQQLIAFTIISCLRFVCWWLEGLISFLFIAFFTSRKTIMILLRYLVHTLNMIFSFVALIIVCSVHFPLNYFHNYSSFSPILTQSILVIYIILSYYLIVTSKLYSVGIPLRTIRIVFNRRFCIPYT